MQTVIRDAFQLLREKIGTKGLAACGNATRNVIELMSTGEGPAFLGPIFSGLYANGLKDEFENKKGTRVNVVEQHNRALTAKSTSALRHF